MNKRILILISILLSIILIGCTSYELIGKVDAIVINKEYIRPRTTTTLVPRRIGKTTMMTPRTRRHPEKYNIKLQHKDMAITVDNKELFDSVDIDDNVEVNLYKKEDKEKIKYEE